MTREQAIQIQAKALAAVEELVSVLEVMKDAVAPEEYEKIKKSIGLSIGAIEMHVNVPLYQQFPDLED